MITLRELFEVTWDISKVNITARKPDNDEYIHSWMFGDDIYETIHMFHRRQIGQVTLVNKKVNHHGEEKRNGSEMGWGVNEKVFPPELIDAEIEHLIMTPLAQGRGTEVICDILIPELTALNIIDRMRGKPDIKMDDPEEAYEKDL